MLTRGFKIDATQLQTVILEIFIRYEGEEEESTIVHAFISRQQKAFFRLSFFRLPRKISARKEGMTAWTCQGEPDLDQMWKDDTGAISTNYTK